MGLYGMHRDVRIGGDILGWMIGVMFWAAVLYFAFLAACAIGLVVLIVWLVRISIRRHRRVRARKARAAAHPPQCPTAARYLHVRNWQDPRLGTAWTASDALPPAATPAPAPTSPAVVASPPATAPHAAPRFGVPAPGAAHPECLTATILATPPSAPQSTATALPPTRADQRRRERQRPVRAKSVRAKPIRQARRAKPRNRRATWALVFGVVALAFGLSGYGTVVAVAPAVAAFVQGGKGLSVARVVGAGRKRAVWGFVLASLGAALWCAFAVFVAL